MLDYALRLTSGHVLRPLRKEKDLYICHDLNGDEILICNALIKEVIHDAPSPNGKANGR